MQFLLFQIDDHTLALSLEYVKRVIQAVAINSALTKAEQTLGVINVHGCVTPVINTRKTLNIKDKELSPTDQFVLCELNGKTLALCVDRTTEIIICQADELLKDSCEISNNPLVSSYIKKASKLIYIYDIKELECNKVH